MSKCIGGVAHDAVGSLATHKLGKSFGELFEEKKAQLDTLQAGLASSVLPKTPPTPPPPPINEDGIEESAPELSFCQTVAMVALSLIKGMAPTIKVNGHWIGNAGTSIQHLPGIFAHIPLSLLNKSLNLSLLTF